MQGYSQLFLLLQKDHCPRLMEVSRWLTHQFGSSTLYEHTNCTNFTKLTGIFARLPTWCCKSLYLEDAVGGGGVTWWNFYFRLFPGAIRSPQITNVVVVHGTMELQDAPPEAVQGIGTAPLSTFRFIRSVTF